MHATSFFCRQCLLGKLIVYRVLYALRQVICRRKSMFTGVYNCLVRCAIVYYCRSLSSFGLSVAKYEMLLCEL